MNKDVMTDYYRNNPKDIVYSLRSEVLQGVVRFIALYDHEYDPVRLIRQLQRTSPIAIYRSGQAMSGPNHQKYMLQVLKAYNGSSRTKSLPIKQ